MGRKQYCKQLNKKNGTNTERKRHNNRLGKGL